MDYESLTAGRDPKADDGGFPCPIFSATCMIMIPVFWLFVCLFWFDSCLHDDFQHLYAFGGMIRFVRLILL